MSGRRRQSKVSECLGAIHDVTPRLQCFKSILKDLRFRCVRLRQQTRKIVQRLIMIRIHFNHFAPTLNRSGTIPIAQRSLSHHEERVGIVRIDTNGLSEQINGLLRLPRLFRDDPQQIPSIREVRIEPCGRLKLGFRFHVSLQIDENPSFVVMRRRSFRTKFYRFRKFLQRTLEIKLIGESYTQIQVRIRRPRIKLDDFPKVRDRFRRLAEPSKHHGSRRERFGVVRFKTDSRLKGLICFGKSRLTSQNQSASADLPCCP